MERSGGVDATPVVLPGRHLFERTLHLRVGPPTIGLAQGSEATDRIAVDRQLGERLGRRPALTLVVLAEASECAIGCYATAMLPADRELFEMVLGRGPTAVEEGRVVSPGL